MEQFEKLIEHPDLKGATHIQVSVMYGKNRNPRGYYLYVTPVTKQEGMVSFVISSGCSKLLFETSRFTASQFARAVTEAEKHEMGLIATVIEKNKAS